MLNFTRTRTYTSPYLGVCLLRYDDDVDGRLCRFDVQGTDMQFDQITSWEWNKVICIQTHFTCGGETLITKTIKLYSASQASCNCKTSVVSYTG